ncbi:MAG: bifunctional diguanylate cyclase/phosphodiesterase [Gammaproteobacteria bacterium]|nr:bifunctional diguanylate cyclase/phosphodiesterase [Gammaproteobacteria bacterium]
MKDTLTDINDRQQFIKMLKSSVQRANEEKGKLALLVVRLNRLSRLNKIYDYNIGDEVLKFLARKLLEVKRPQDFVGRLYGPTFGLVVNHIMNKGHAQLAALKILRLLEIPLEVDDSRVFLDVSIGISICPTHSSVGNGLLKKAETALDEAHLHENKIAFTEEAIVEEISEFWDIELGIEQAIINSEFQLYYQPKICLQTGIPVGAEALIRWPHPSRGMIFPDQFVPIAEDHGHIKPMTIWILNVALRESTEWTKQWGKLSVSINVPPDLMDSELVDLVENAINIWAPENKLVLEILERSFALSDEGTFKTFQALQDLGAEISIDDFGTGYSALSYFKSIPAKELKIDQSFVRTLLSEHGNLDIVTFVIQLAHAFNMRIVAEGVEDLTIAKKLKELGCDYIQGYYLAKAMPHQEFLLWLKNYKIPEELGFEASENSTSQFHSDYIANIKNDDIAIDLIDVEESEQNLESNKESSETKSSINDNSIKIDLGDSLI